MIPIMLSVEKLMVDEKGKREETLDRRGREGEKSAMERETNVKEKSIDETCRERERARHRQALRVQTIILQGESIINNIERGARALDVSLGAPGKQRRRKRKAGMSRSLGNPVKLGHVVTVELKSGELYRGSMIECEDNWNFSLENTYTAKGKGYSLGVGRGRAVTMHARAADRGAPAVGRVWR